MADESFTKLNNCLLQKLYAGDMNGSEYRAVLYIIRLTLGYHRLTAETNFSDIGIATGMTQKTVRRAVFSLIEKNVISASDDYTRFRLTFEYLTADKNVPKSDKNVPKSGQNCPDSLPIIYKENKERKKGEPTAQNEVKSNDRASGNDREADEKSEWTEL